MAEAQARPPPTGAACYHCGAPDVAIDWYNAFKVLVCSQCFRKYERLISKSIAKSTYLLSDSDMHPLGFVEKQNPRHTKFAVMKQYLVSQVEDVAIKKHGSLEDLEAEKQRRMQGKLEQRIQKRQAAEQEEERQRRNEERLQATLAKYTQSDGNLPEAAGGTDASDDVHGELDPITGRRKKRHRSCFADVEVEEF